MPNLSVYENIKDAVVAQIQTFGFSTQSVAIPNANIVKQKVLTTRQETWPGPPGIIVANFTGKTPVVAGGTNARDDIPYRIVVATILVGNQDQQANADILEYFNETIGRKFRFQPLLAVNTVNTCEIDQDAVFDPPMWFKQFDTSVTVFKFISRESRG